jgi:hypothetical protein
VGRSSCHREASPRRPVFMLHAGLDLSRRKVDVCLLSSVNQSSTDLSDTPDAGNRGGGHEHPRHERLSGWRGTRRPMPSSFAMCRRPPWRPSVGLGSPLRVWRWRRAARSRALGAEPGVRGRRRPGRRTCRGCPAHGGGDRRRRGCESHLDRLAATSGSSPTVSQRDPRMASGRQDARSGPAVRVPLLT